MMTKEFDNPCVRPPEFADNVSLPPVSILRVLDVATPFTAVTAPLPVKVPGPPAFRNVTDPPKPRSVLPFASVAFAVAENAESFSEFGIDPTNASFVAVTSITFFEVSEEAVAADVSNSELVDPPAAVSFLGVTLKKNFLPSDPAGRGFFREILICRSFVPLSGAEDVKPVKTMPDVVTMPVSRCVAPSNRSAARIAAAQSGTELVAFFVSFRPVRMVGRASVSGAVTPPSRILTDQTCVPCALVSGEGLLMIDDTVADSPLFARISDCVLTIGLNVIAVEVVGVKDPSEPSIVTPASAVLYRRSDQAAVPDAAACTSVEAA